MTTRNFLLLTYLLTSFWKILSLVSFHKRCLLAFGGWGRGLALEGDVQSQTGAACLSTLNGCVATDAMVMRPSIAPSYVTAWCSYSVVGAIGPYWL